MNETEYIFTVIVAFLTGYGIAYSAKNVGRLYRKWGLLICYFVFPAVGVALIFLAAMIADMQDVLLSVAFGIGFIFRMFKRG